MENVPCCASLHLASPRLVATTAQLFRPPYCILVEKSGQARYRYIGGSSDVACSLLSESRKSSRAFLTRAPPSLLFRNGTTDKDIVRRFLRRDVRKVSGLGESRAGCTHSCALDTFRCVTVLETVKFEPCSNGIPRAVSTIRMIPRDESLYCARGGNVSRETSKLKDELVTGLCAFPFLCNYPQVFSRKFDALSHA